jgi:hypothetical protein
VLWSKTRNSSALVLLTLTLATPLMAQEREPGSGMTIPDSSYTSPRLPSECRAYAVQRSNEEFLAHDSSLRRNSPFQSGPAGMRDPWTDSQRQDANIDRAAREQLLYDACLEWLKQQK